MTADPPSFVADVASQVVAWHNRHPLARRISRRDVQGIGIVVLPYAREALPPWHATSGRRGLLALMFSRRIDRRPWPVFNEDAVPGLTPKRLAAFGLRHGFVERPGPPGEPERVLQTDRDLLDAARGEQPPEQFNRYLVTAAIDIGPRRPRVMLGHGRRMPVLGRRLWSVPRLAVLGGAALAAMVVGVAGLWLTAMPQRPGLRPLAPAASAASPAAARVPASVPSAPPSGATAAAASASAVAAQAATALPPASAAAAPSTASVVAPALPAASVTAPTAPPASATAPAAPVVAAPPSAPAAAAPVAAPSVPARPASAAAPLASAPAPTPPQPAVVETRRASAPLVPRLKPDLAEAARAEAQKHGLPPPAPRASAAGERAGTAPPGRPGASQPGKAAFYALVSRPLRQRAEAEALLKRLRAETDRIAHPTAIETGLQQTPEGWRVTWWPFTHPRQAENARAALAARRVELELVEF